MLTAWSAWMKRESKHRNFHLTFSSTTRRARPTSQSFPCMESTQTKSSFCPSKPFRNRETTTDKLRNENNTRKGTEISMEQRGNQLSKELNDEGMEETTDELTTKKKQQRNNGELFDGQATERTEKLPVTA